MRGRLRRGRRSCSQGPVISRLGARSCRDARRTPARCRCRSRRPAAATRRMPTQSVVLTVLPVAQLPGSRNVWTSLRSKLERCVSDRSRVARRRPQGDPPSAMRAPASGAPSVGVVGRSACGTEWTRSSSAGLSTRAAALDSPTRGNGLGQGVTDSGSSPSRISVGAELRLAQVQGEFWRGPTCCAFRTVVGESSIPS